MTSPRPDIVYPNIVYIDCHDLGDWVGCYGRSHLQTPHLDRLAQQGALFSQMIATAPICMPSRAGLYTSQMPHEVGAVGQFPFHEDTVCMAEHLRRAGYETVLAGERLMIRNDPGWAGFEQRIEVIGDEAKAEAAAGFLGQRGPDSEQPFFLAVSFHRVHRPFGQEVDEALAKRLTVPPYLPDIPLVRRDLAALHTQIASLDRLVGRILESLDAAGLGANTLVVFATEHGPPIARAKHTLYDSGLRAALLMRYPPLIQPGRRHEQLLSNLDILPTILDLAHVEAPASLRGISFAPLLRGQSQPVRDYAFAEHTWGRRAGLPCYTPARAVRTERFKYIRNDTETPCYIDTDWLARFGPDRTLPQTRYGRPAPPVELYDLAADPYELENRAGVAGYVDIQQELAQRLERFLLETGDPILHGFVPNPDGLADVPLWERQADGTFTLRAYRPEESGERPFS